MVQGLQTTTHRLHLLLGQSLGQLVHGLHDILELHLALIVAGLNHVHGHAGSHTVQVLLLGVHQGIYAAVGTLGHQHDAGAAQRAEHHILVAVSGHRLLLNLPAATHRVHGCTASAGLTLNLREGGGLRATAQDQHGHNGGGTQTQNKEGNPVTQGNADEDKDQESAQGGQAQNPTDIRVGLLGHLVDLLHLGEGARSAFLLLFLLFALICHDSSSVVLPRSRGASNAHGTIVT